MEKITNKAVNILRKFFQVSTTAFEFQERIVSILVGRTYNGRSHMYILHIAALDELNKDEPDLKLIDTLLSEMERLAESNKNK